MTLSRVVHEHKTNVTANFSQISSKKNRLAVFTLLRTTSWEAINSFASSYSFSTWDLFVLHDGGSLDFDLLQKNVAKPIHFIDVSSFFQRLLIRGIKQTSCFSHPPHLEDGYRLMCRFLSGPVYWLPEFDSYDQILRFDADSRFTGLVSSSLELESHQVYAYTLLSHDPLECQLGILDLLREVYSTSSVLRWGKNVYSAPWVRLVRRDNSWFTAGNPDVTVFNCNFEVASLSLFRSNHFRKFWAHIDQSGLFFSTRLGDHELKTVYLETFQPEESVVCYSNLPYSHPHPIRCNGENSRHFS